jgi:hypothetical protein
MPWVGAAKVEGAAGGGGEGGASGDWQAVTAADGDVYYWNKVYIYLYIYIY